MNVLRELDKPGIMSMKNIGDKVGLDDDMLEHILGDLEQRGYVKKVNVTGSGCVNCARSCPFAGKTQVSFSTWETTDKGKTLLENSR